MGTQLPGGGGEYPHSGKYASERHMLDSDHPTQPSSRLNCESPGFCKIAHD